jgi:hypothetical protein
VPVGVIWCGPCSEGVAVLLLLSLHFYLVSRVKFRVGVSPTSSWVVVLRSLFVGRFLTRLKSINWNRSALDVCQTCSWLGFILRN